MLTTPSNNLVSRARRLRCVGGTEARGKGGKEHLVTIDRFLWHGGIQCTWHHQMSQGRIEI